MIDQNTINDELYYNDIKDKDILVQQLQIGDVFLYRLAPDVINDVGYIIDIVIDIVPEGEGIGERTQYFKVVWMYAIENNSNKNITVNYTNETFRSIRDKWQYLSYFPIIN